MKKDKITYMYRKEQTKRIDDTITIFWNALLKLKNKQPIEIMILPSKDAMLPDKVAGHWYKFQPSWYDNENIKLFKPISKEKVFLMLL